VVWNNRALALWSAGRNAEALRLFERTVALRERALGADHVDTANALSNMANVLKTYEDKGNYSAHHL
jgi:hypothetical protein